MSDQRRENSGYASTYINPNQTVSRKEKEL